MSGRRPQQRCRGVLRACYSMGPWAAAVAREGTRAARPAAACIVLLHLHTSRGANTLDSAIFSLTAKVMHHESLAAAAAEKTVAAMAAEHELALAQLRCELSAEARDGEALASQLEAAAQQLEDARGAADAAQAEAAAARGELQQVGALGVARRPACSVHACAYS